MSNAERMDEEPVYADFAHLYDAFMQDADYDAWYRVYRQFLPFEIENKRIADLCCGTGQITRRLKREGAQVVGVDLSRQMLEIAQEATRKAGMQIPYVQQSIDELELPRRQDAILCVCDGVNYLPRPALEAFLSRALRFLKKDGVLLFDVSTVHKLQMQEAQPYFDVRDDAALLWQSSWEDGALHMQVTGFARLPESDTYRRFDEEHVLYGYSRETLEGLLKDSGFVLTDTLDLDTGKAETPDTQRLLLCAKPAVV